MRKENKKTSYDIYIDSIKDIPILSLEEETGLSVVIHSEESDESQIQSAIDKLVISNLKLVVKYAQEYYNNYKETREFSLSLMDLIEEGNFGLIKSASSFDHEKGRFTTHASWHIKKWIRQAHKNHRFIRIPANHHAILNKIRVLENEETKIDDKVKKEVANEFNVSVKLIDLIIVESSNKVQSLNVSASDGESVISMLDMIPSEEESGPDKIESEEKKKYLMGKIKTLSPSEQEIIFARYFKSDPATYEEIAKKQGISKQRVSQIANDALKKLHRKIKEDKALGNY
jgi:RNA polymerase sigma factor (sigma-70 family)